METLTEPQALSATPRVKTNLDTNFLKLIAIISMLFDHAGAVFFPQNEIFHLIGRVAFPLFLYCTYVGAIYTRSIKKYMLRLGFFAVASQLPYVLAFQETPAKIAENWFYPNVIFTLFFAVLLVYGMRQKKWWLIVPAAAVMMLAPLDYGCDALALTLIFYLLRNKPQLSCALTALYLATAFFTADDMSLFNIAFGVQGFAALAVPLIMFKTELKPKINKYFFYIFYPSHLLLLFVLRVALAR